MLAIYKGREYCGRTIGDYRFELRSKERIDDTFEYKKGVYIKNYLPIRM